jgi:hypothetical protein
VTTRKRRESSRAASPASISAEAGDWIRQFVKHLELHLLDAGRELSPDADTAEMQLATARAVLATYCDSGMEVESAVELLGQAAVESRSVDVVWNDEMNRRRFDLIDKEIQGSLTPAESVELAGLTSIMRHHVDSETNLPMKGARALHRKLLQLDSTDQID